MFEVGKCYKHNVYEHTICVKWSDGTSHHFTLVQLGGMMAYAAVPDRIIGVELADADLTFADWTEVP